MRNPPGPTKGSNPIYQRFGQSADSSLLTKGYWKGGMIKPPDDDEPSDEEKDRNQRKNWPKMIEPELESNRGKSVVREPDTEDPKDIADDTPDSEEA